MFNKYRLFDFVFIALSRKLNIQVINKARARKLDPAHDSRGAGNKSHKELIHDTTRQMPQLFVTHYLYYSDESETNLKNWLLCRRAHL